MLLHTFFVSAKTETNQTVYNSINFQIKYFQPVFVILELVETLISLDSSIKAQESELLKR